MEQPIGETIQKHFGSIPEPRLERTRLHELMDIMVIAICAVICGADSWEEIEDFGNAKEAWLRTVLSLSHGIPSHDTFRRVFGLIDAEAFQRSFVSWVQSVTQLIGGQVIAVDGKKPRGSQDRGIGKGAIDMVSAWASANQVVLGQVKVDDKSNEIKAIPELLRMLVIRGCIVTVDSMGCQVEVAQTCVDQEADYVLALKENQPHLYWDVVRLFEDLEASQMTAYPYDYAESFDNTHGRAEKRQCWTIADPLLVGVGKSCQVSSSGAMHHYSKPDNFCVLPRKRKTSWRTCLNSKPSFRAQESGSARITGCLIFWANAA
jgi:predicted transposase YbfD/YdcC